jgi:thymidylate synthase
MSTITTPTKELRIPADAITKKAYDAIQKHMNNSAIVPAENKIYYGYETMLSDVLCNGKPKADRTGTGTWGIHGYQLRFDVDKGFPLVTTKKCHMKSIIYENLWFLKGDTNIAYLKEHGVKIWDEWADENGNLGPVYGKQWRNWQTSYVNNEGKIETISIDQIQNTIKSLTENPGGRRHIINAWNVAEIGEMRLTPCHCLFQFHTSLMTLDARRLYAKTILRKDTTDLSDDDMDTLNIPVYQLDLQLYQRSCDIFLGVPFNIASYAMLLLMVAQVTNMKPGEFIHDFGDLHIYQNHLDQVVEQLSRTPFKYPTMKLNPEVKSIFDFKYEDFTLEDYESHDKIKGEVSV